VADWYIFSELYIPLSHFGYNAQPQRLNHTLKGVVATHSNQSVIKGYIIYERKNMKINFSSSIRVSILANVYILNFLT
jgi:hypothetical protein